MSVTEIIEAIKALPVEDRAKVIAFMRNFVSSNNTEQHVSYIDPDEAVAVAKTVFSENDELFRKLAQ